MIDYARLRQPQRFKDGLGMAVIVAPLRPCPLRPDKMLYHDEGPHAVSWLAVRGDTVKLRHG